MRAATSVAALSLMVLAGCATPEPPPQMRYQGPDSGPATTTDARIPQDEELVWGQLLDRLQQSPLTVGPVDRDAGVIVATYSGDPEPYVDCGWILAYGAEDLTRIPASTYRANWDWPANGDTRVLKRSLDLDGRMVVRVRPSGRDTLVSAGSTYVLTKRIDLEASSGQLEGRNAETISFNTGERARFTKGTVCQATGNLEQLAFDAFPTGAARGIAAASTSAAEASEELNVELDCAGADRAFCRALDIVQPYRVANEEQGLGLAVRTSGRRSATLFEGDIFALDFTFPNYAAYLHVVYIQASGVVGHVLPGAGRKWPANAENFVKQTEFEIAEPFGVEVILALATEQPLFPNPRPRFESGDDYLDALQQRLSELVTDNPGTRIAADHLIVKTEPRRSLAASAL